MHSQATASTPSFSTASETVASSSTLPTSETRMEVLQRTLHLLRQEVLVPYFEFVERLRVTNNRAVRVQDVVETLHTASFGEKGSSA
ncbi:hypothetical protein C3747_88g937c [Trypanosoma cruzi]|uniref:Uncharacterized protein n=2 Tax=Trypanosoma cruzi TaxID=5693 RepID=Q4DT42_TRYCC|nr:hypothetical protein, conserved [Trypanosoma cruzi]EAN95716.1 hypothetical protein, conserved [Trypanosoma cruzi]KAF8298157.1 hypothetical protein TcYC6_0076030 [Trypanosoma cruzi]PWV08594.1 hypothetical protein C3747_88g937c [Trypanosoma cruzi]|eukprot:XP_817567.1 hypothetical protein [Trypanosoma cruzi strain CL Brener]